MMASQSATDILQNASQEENIQEGSLIKITKLEPRSVYGYIVGDVKYAVFTNGVTVAETIPNDKTLLNYIFTPTKIDITRMPVLEGVLEDYDAITANRGQKYAMQVRVELQSLCQYKEIITITSDFSKICLL